MFLLIDNYDSFTWNLVQRIGEIDRTEEVRVVRNDKITPAEVASLQPSGILISPGPGAPTEAGVCNEILTRFAGEIPILGVCLGHQCIAHSHGMSVVRHSRIMHGKTSEIHHDGAGLFSGMSNPFIATRYHSLIVARETVASGDPGILPVGGRPPRCCHASPGVMPGDEEGAHSADSGVEWNISAWTRDTLASGEEVEVVMGLRRVWRTPRAVLEGVQFHPESFLTTEGPVLLANFLNVSKAWEERKHRDNPASSTPQTYFAQER